MELQRSAADAVTGAIAKASTGISGLDEVLDGGLPRGRPTIITGRAGCGKTLLSMEFLVRGAREFAEPGVFVSFEESPRELIENMASLGFDVAGLQADGKLLLGGWSYRDNSSAGDFVAVRLLASGALDTTFGENGIALRPVAAGTRADNARGMVLQSDERVPTVRAILGGEVSGSNNDFGLLRLWL